MVALHEAPHTSTLALFGLLVFKQFVFGFP